MSFLPQLISRAAPVSGLLRGDRVRERLRVHEREHQHLVGLVVRRDARDQAIRSELRLERQAELDLRRGGAGGEDVGAHVRIQEEVPSFRR